MARAKHNPHPLRALFMARSLTEQQGMNWLQDRGLVSDWAATPEGVHPEDVRRVMDLAQVHTFSMEWIESTWEAWRDRMKKVEELSLTYASACKNVETP